MQVTNVEFTDNSKQVIEEMQRKAKIALEAVGIQAEGHCKQELSNTPKRIDTGLLRNSITLERSVKNGVLFNQKRQP